MCSTINKLAASSGIAFDGDFDWTVKVKVEVKGME
jgi:hypothetical protein